MGFVTFGWSRPSYLRREVVRGDSGIKDIAVNWDLLLVASIFLYCNFMWYPLRNVPLQTLCIRDSDVFRKVIFLVPVFTIEYSYSTLKFKQTFKSMSHVHVLYKHRFCLHRHIHTPAWRISIAGYHPDTSLLLFPYGCPGDRRHVAAGGCRGGCWCLPASSWSSRSEDHMPTSNKGFVHRHTHRLTEIHTILYSRSWLKYQSSFLSSLSLVASWVSLFFFNSISRFLSLYLWASLTLFFSSLRSLFSVWLCY